MILIRKPILFTYYFIGATQNKEPTPRVGYSLVITSMPGTRYVSSSHQRLRPQIALVHALAGEAGLSHLLGALRAHFATIVQWLSYARKTTYGHEFRVCTSHKLPSTHGNSDKYSSIIFAYAQLAVLAPVRGRIEQADRPTERRIRSSANMQRDPGMMEAACRVLFSMRTDTFYTAIARAWQAVSSLVWDA